MFGIDLVSAALGFVACAVVSVKWPKAGQAIHDRAARAIEAYRKWRRNRGTR
jgi:hypothetical protein